MKLKQVRRSKKELAHERNAVSSLLHKHYKAKSKTLTTQFRDVDLLFKEYGLPDAEQLLASIDALIAEYREGRGRVEDHDLMIFDPECDDLTTLPIGVLDHKELPLPDALIPQTREALLRHCERMIVRSRKSDLIAYVVAGWPGCDVARTDIRMGSKEASLRAQEYLSKHVSTLWLILGQSRDLYDAIVCGRHGSALRLLRTIRLAGGLTEKAVRQVIAEQGLLWCANDLQMNVARGALGARNPFGQLASTTQIEMKPERPINDMKQHLSLMRLALDLYATSAEENDELAPKPLAKVPDDELAQTLARRLETAANLDGRDLMALRSKLDDLVVRIRSNPTYGADIWWKELAKPVKANGSDAHFSGLWFSKLSHVRAAAVTVLRYMQAECWMERLLRERKPESDRSAAREDVAMPLLDVAELGPDYLQAAQDLLFLYRREILRDKMVTKMAATLAGTSKNAGAETITAGLQFLMQARPRRIGDDEGGRESLARTMYLLDVIPESRLCR